MIEAFRPSLVRRVTGLTQRQLHRLARWGVVQPSVATGEGAWPSLYSFEDVVKLKAAAEMLKRDFNVPKLRTLVEEYMRRGDENPLVTLRLIGDPEHPDDPDTGKKWRGRVIVVDAATEEPRGPAHPDQVAELFDLPMKDLRAGLVGTIDELTRRPTGSVEKVRGVHASRPVVVGTRVPTKLIARLAEEGWDAGRIMQAYPVLTPEDVAAALEFERRDQVA